MADTAISKGDEGWESLYREWLSQKKPGYLSLLNGTVYRVLQPSDDDVKFLRRGGFDDMYGSQSRGTS